MFPDERVTLRDRTGATIRPLDAADGEALADLYASLRPVDKRFYFPHPLTREEALKTAARATSPDFACLVVECGDGSLAGYAWFQWEPGAERSVFGICVRPEMQERGVGGALLAVINRLAERVGPGVMSLTVQKANTRALALYRKMGFSEVRDQSSALNGEPEFYMERQTRAGASS
jgi:ribosomal protein S18 acetylase RimI-like enzyme